MLHPNQYQVNQAWIAFKLNDTPIITERDGDYNMLALMDAASCFILDIGYIPTDLKEISPMEAERLLSAGYRHKQQYPQELMIPSERASDTLKKEAEQRGIHVVLVPEGALQLFIGEARESFQQFMGKGRLQ